MVGTVLSMLMPPSVTLAVLPAWSVTLLVTLWSAPSPKTASAGQAPSGTPDSASEQMKWTLTAVLFQPYPLGCGSTEAVMDGPCGSILAETVRVMELPAT